MGSNKLTDENRLSIKHADVAKWLAPTELNKNITADQLAVNSNKKVYWVCENCRFVYPMIVQSRVKGSKPRLCDCNRLSINNPYLSSEWHPQKNGVLVPEEISVGSQRKVWWKCHRCHYEWETTVWLRHVRNTGCKRCNSKGTSLPEQAIFYYLSQVYHNVKHRYIFKVENQSLEADIFLPALHTVVEYDGHYFHSGKTKAAYDLRKNEQLGKAGLHTIRIREELPPLEQSTCFIRKNLNSLSSLDEVIKTLLTYLAEKDKKNAEKLNAIIVNTFQDFITIQNQYYKREISNSVLHSHNETVKMYWDFEKNEIKPEYVSSGSKVRLHFYCKTHQQGWQAYAYNIFNGGYIGCKKCEANKNANTRRSKVEYKKSVAYTHSKLVEQYWDFEKNIVKPEEVTAGSHFKLHFYCKEHDKHWQAAAYSVFGNHSSGCKACESKKKSAARRRVPYKRSVAHTHKELVEQYWDFNKNIITPDKISFGHSGRIFFYCKEHQTAWDSIASNVFRLGAISCRKCRTTTSK
ncbi:zinc-ribbon domain-containing protein [Domibacillus sp. DTU_2020_1001157_1_SI_ALB_TIR_016]|uniref:zinc-ribbon domain-containing protein n=1 Tax=Domibacillus sp. DTU_2020_1001157_1_SI_ALB_TIR_016 TaxID=3077789 RepID=UPI0028EEA945|nr:zinc-ribbon domain-containing protein [Domibacillus sp. DTU_2020_1001157_1_SI_ALB_TIR_016]WNS82220.1 zinc-ribbon domain-containing protein [Domibacillus sp. DTU_2020_1001157_1_SI_ALB_TIR_016]